MWWYRGQVLLSVSWIDIWKIYSTNDRKTWPRCVPAATCNSFSPTHTHTHTGRANHVHFVCNNFRFTLTFILVLCHFPLSHLLLSNTESLKCLKRTSELVRRLKKELHRFVINREIFSLQKISTVIRKTIESTRKLKRWEMRCRCFEQTLGFFTAFSWTKIKWNWFGAHSTIPFLGELMGVIKKSKVYFNKFH